MAEEYPQGETGPVDELTATAVGPRGDAASQIRRFPGWMLIGAVCVAAAVVLLLWLSSKPRSPDQDANVAAVAPAASDASPSASHPPGHSPPATAQPSSAPGDAPSLLESVKNQAEVMAEAIIARYPQDPFCYYLRGQLHVAFREAEASERDFQRALELDPRFTKALIAMVWFSLSKSDYAEAAVRARRALAADPTSADAHDLLAQALCEMGRMEEAIAVAEEDLRQHPDSPQSHYLAGRAYLQLNKLEKARDHYEAALKINPGYVHAYYGLATVCAKLGKQDESAAHLRKFKELRDKISQVQLDRVRTADALKTSQSVAGVFAMAGEVHLRHGDPYEAEKVLKRGVALCPSDTQCRAALVRLYRQQRRLRDAVETLGALAAIEPGKPEHYLNIGVLRAELRDVEGAERAFHCFRELAPQAALGHAMLAKLYLDANRKTQEATALARKAVELAPAAANYRLLAEACQRNGDRDGARKAAARATELESHEPTSRQQVDGFQPQR